MKIAIFSYSRQGCETAKKLFAALADEECRLYAPGRFCDVGFETIPSPGESLYAECFAHCDAMVFVGSCGIAVRCIAPYVKSKTEDPAVIVVDERAKHVIPLLSGHIGGANKLAHQLAESIGAEAVISTATDINGRFSVDAWAAQKGFAISDLSLCKTVSAAILERDIPLCTDFPLMSSLPNGLVMEERGKLGIYIGWDERQPFDKTLRLVPRCLSLGIGCRRGTGMEAIEFAVDSVIKENGIDRRAITSAASIDLKADEQGLLDYCIKAGMDIDFYSASELEKVQGTVSESAFVKSITGLDNVCERAALINADKLIVKKTAINGVTVALAAKMGGLSFD